MVELNYRNPHEKIEQQWTYGSGGSARGERQGYNATWWKTFKDPVLNNLIEVAYRNTLDAADCRGSEYCRPVSRTTESIGNLFPQQQGLSGALNTLKLKCQTDCVHL